MVPMVAAEPPMNERRDGPVAVLVVVSGDGWDGRDGMVTGAFQ
jgi:hypothetical protein